MAPESDRLEEVLIVGTGAMATLFAARLGLAGYSVSIWGTWQPALRALGQNGARLVGTDGREHQVRVKVYEQPRDTGSLNTAIVLVKSWQTARVAEQLARWVAPAGIAITLQNGLGNRELLADRLGASRVALGTTTAGATLLGPGLAKSGGEGVVTLESHPRLQHLQDAFTAAGFRVEVIRDARALIWGKLIVSSAINPLTAILRVPNGELLNRPAARQLLRILAEETAAVARAEGVQLPSADPVDLVEVVATNTGSNHSSMLQDVQRGAPTEIDAICGEITRAGARHGISTPMNEACMHLVRALVQGSPLAGQRA